MGSQYNPFSADEDGDTHLGVTILKRVAKDISCTYQISMNKIIVTL